MKTAAQWKTIGFHPHHGICIPLFALRTKTSSGIGEFLDLIPFISWCKELGFDCLQLLPLNDTGSDCSPYSPLSCTALDPIYLTLNSLPESSEVLHPFNSFQQLNKQPHLIRGEVKSLKLDWLRLYFQRTFPSLSKTSIYQQFVNTTPWLADYARFKALKEAFEGRHWKEWPITFAAPIPSKCQDEVNFHCFLQYHCWSQMRQVHAFANQNSFLIQGDMPILPASDSVDVWANPALFRLDLLTGAPPDLYNPSGQIWGFPPFAYDAMRRAHLTWWKERLTAMESIYHMYRIDHVVGLFRLWVIPKEEPTTGHFIPENPLLWGSQGREILETMIDVSSLLPIAEDLGTIPPIVYTTLKELGICGTKVMRWQKSDSGYLPLNEYEPLSVTTLSTPDMDPFPLWWKRSPTEAAHFAKFKHWTYHPLLTSDQQLEMLWDSHHTKSLFHINPIQEYLFPFPDLARMHLEEERINVPGTIAPTNWTYRLRPYLEELCHHRPLADAITSVMK